MTIPTLWLPDWVLEFISGETEDIIIRGMRMFALSLQILVMLTIAAIYIWNCTRAQNANTNKTLPLPSQRPKKNVRIQEEDNVVVPSQDSSTSVSESDDSSIEEVARVVPETQELLARLEDQANKPSTLNETEEKRNEKEKDSPAKNDMGDSIVQFTNVRRRSLRSSVRKQENS